MVSSLLIDDLHTGRPYVEIFGNTRVIIENHQGILEYDMELLRVKCNGCAVCIRGMDLELTALSLNELAVTGTIASVEYTSEGQEKL